jgi:hypothetical protein
MVLFADRGAVAPVRIAPDAGALLDRELTEAAQLDPVAARQHRGDLVEDRGDDNLRVAVVKVRGCLRQALDEA